MKVEQKENRHRSLDNGMYVKDLGYREKQPIALLERTFKDGTKEYIIAFSYEIKNNSIDWGYGYYYSDDVKKAQEDFKKVLSGGTLSDTFINRKENKNMEENKLVFCTEEEIVQIIKSKEELYFADDGIDEVIVKLDDIPDFIVDINRKIGITNLKFYKIDNLISEPDIKTMGEYLDKISPELREKIIDRLVQLQTGKLEPKEYKIIDENLYEDVKIKLEQEEITQNNKKKNKNREAR
jgi:hypothetical protein